MTGPARAALNSPALWFGATCLSMHLVANSGYGAFRDELYFIVCGRHPAFGYVDQPPLMPWIAAAAHAAFGVALTPLRLAPALAMTATVALTCLYARALGGGRYAQILTGLCALLAPVLLAEGLLLSTDMLQPLTWLGCSFVLTRLVQSGDERWWLAFGACVGLGLASKYLIAFYLVGLAVGIMATPLRHALARPYLYAGAAIALALAAPNLLWQASHDWPFLEIGRVGATGKNTAFSPLGFAAEQVLIAGPAAAPVWLAGLFRLARPGAEPRLRAIPIAYAVMAVLFFAGHGKPYYLAPIYPTLFAAGAVMWEQWLERPLVRAAAAAVVAIAGLAIMPMALPILAPDNFVRYAGALGIAPAPMERGPQSVLPQYFADMFGWRDMAAEIARVYRALPETERADAVFFGRNYGQAAAIDILGRDLGGPPAISGHNNYFLWGTLGFRGSVVITAGEPPRALASNYAERDLAGHIARNLYAMPREQDLPVYVLRRPQRPLDDIWPSLRHYE